MSFLTRAFGLTLKWPTRGTKNWDTTMLSDFCDKISAHDHTGGGKGLTIGATALAANAVTTVKITDLNVTAAKLAADAVETAKIKDAAVTQAKLAIGLSPTFDNETVAAAAGTALIPYAITKEVTLFTHDDTPKSYVSIAAPSHAGQLICLHTTFPGNYEFSFPTVWFRGRSGAGKLPGQWVAPTTGYYVVLLALDLVMWAQLGGDEDL